MAPGGKDGEKTMSAGAGALPARPFFWPKTAAFTYLHLTLIMIGLLTLLRLIVLSRMVLDLGPDEAQYWAWAQDLAFGYFSKPPMIAWVIALTTGVCGDGEACVRAGAPLLHAGTALIIFFLARSLIDARAAFWSALTYATIPAVWFSSGIISTDVPLLFFWALALFAFHEFIRSRTNGEAGFGWALLLGAALGLGMLAKYATIYFLLCAALYAAVSAPARRALLSPAAAFALLIAALTFSPNLYWNWAEGFPTAKHTVANANWGGSLFNPEKLAEFFVGQFGVFGPLMMVMLLWGLLTLRKRLAAGNRDAALFLLAFSMPILLVVMGQSFISRANANWAGLAYVAATILVISWMLSANARILLRVSTIIHLICGLTLYAIIAIPGAMRVTATTELFKRARGWDELGALIEANAAASGARAIMADDRLVTAEIRYYAREAGLPVVMWDVDGVPQNHFEWKTPFRPETPAPLLYVTPSPNPTLILDRFSDKVLLETMKLPSKNEEIRIWRLAGFKG